MRTIKVVCKGETIFTMEDKWDNVDKSIIPEITKCFVGLSSDISIDERTPKERLEND